MPINNLTIAAIFLMSSFLSFSQATIPVMGQKIPDRSGNSDAATRERGNTNVANTLSSPACVAAGCYFDRPSTSTDTDNIPNEVFNSGLQALHGQDQTHGSNIHYFLNAGNFGSNSVKTASKNNYYWTGVPKYPLNPNFIGHLNFAFAATGGLYVGSPWTQFHTNSNIDYFYTRSIALDSGSFLYCYKVGDCLNSSENMLYRNGTIGGADEGDAGRELHMTEVDPPSGTIAIGGANVSTIKANFTSNAGRQADGMNLLSETEIGASGLLLSGTKPGGNIPYRMTTSDSHATNTAYASLSSACGVNVTRNLPVATACTITGLTGSFSAEANATVCVADWRYPEQVAVTTASSRSVTLILAYTHPAGTVIEQGPMCGQKLVLGYGKTNPLMNQFVTSYFVAGSPTATTLDVVVAWKGGQNGKLGVPIPSLPTVKLGKLTRTSNFVSVPMAANSGLINYNNFTSPSGAVITISGASNPDFNGAITGVNSRNLGTATWPQNGADETATGATLSLVGYNNYATYCGAEVVKIGGVTFPSINYPEDAKLDGTMQLEANNCNWPVGQAIIQPNHYSSSTAADNFVLGGFTPPIQGRNVVRTTTTGGAAWSRGIDDKYMTNDTYADYIGGGGTQIGHTHLLLDAFYQNVINMQDSPLDNGVFLQTGCPPEGCNSGFSWNILQLQGAFGASRFSFTPSTNSFHIDNLTIGKSHSPIAMLDSANNFTGPNAFAVGKIATTLANGAGLQIATASGCAIMAGALGNNCSVAVRLPVAEPDTAYKVSGCIITGSTGDSLVTVGAANTLNTTGFSIPEIAMSAVNRGGGTINCTVVHN